MYTIKVLICFILFTCSLSACEKDRPYGVIHIVPQPTINFDTTKAIYPDDRLYITGVYIDSVIDSVTHGAYNKFPRHSYWGYAKQPLRIKIDTIRIDTVDWHYGVNTFNFDATIWSGDWWF